MDFRTSPKQFTTTATASWNLLLAGRDISKLSSEELLLLAQGYNWWCNQAQAFETAKVVSPGSRTALSGSRSPAGSAECLCQ